MLLCLKYFDIIAVHDQMHLLIALVKWLCYVILV